MRWQSDHIDSDNSELEAVLEYSAREAAKSNRARKQAEVEPTRSADSGFEKKQQLNGCLSALERELRDVDEQIVKLQELRATIVAETHDVREQLLAQSQTRQVTGPSLASKTQPKAGSSNVTINYETEQFEWDEMLLERMRKVFKISSFRLCQKGVCNASMNGEDIVCVMPTGGGKSLTYQLPALLNPGLTLVISPLISLITDQIMHLRDFVEAVMLLGSTPREESSSIFRRLLDAARSPGNARCSSEAPEIKLCYVTPEKIVQSDHFTSVLTKLADVGKLARIVIDEAHCVSQLGHDFRPDYKKLSKLRMLCPRVPILALSATCPPRVLKDLLSILKMKSVVASTMATPNRTVFFSAPLYRKNLHYKVLPKPSAATASMKAMAEYILEHHEKDSGIIYCLSKKDTEQVAQGVQEGSGGRIKTGVYHADIHDREKERLHQRWRTGEVQVVCATIAFGLGIDKGNVRFVLHHSISKSLEGYYQESGRAGRDGNDSDCVLYFRSIDATRLSKLIYAEKDGLDKLREMLRFALDVEECRKIQFTNYFSEATSLSKEAWSTEETNANARCGHCDNCTRPPETIERRDATGDAWKILRVAQEIKNSGGRVTVQILTELVRGLGGGNFEVKSKGKGQKRGRARKQEVELDLDELVRGKVEMSKEDTERLILHLLLNDYLQESFHQNEYGTNTYIEPGKDIFRITRLELEEIEAGRGNHINLAFFKKESAKKRTTKRTKDLKNAGTREVSRGKKRKSGEVPLDDDDFGGEQIEDDGTIPLFADEIEADDEDAFAPGPSRTERTKTRAQRESSDIDDNETWNYSMSNGANKHPLTKPLPQSIRNFTYAPAAGPSGKAEAKPSQTSASAYGQQKPTFSPVPHAVKSILTSSLSHPTSSVKPGNFSPVVNPQAQRGTFTPSTSSAARRPCSNVINTLTKRTPQIPKTHSAMDVIEIDSDSERSLM